LTRYPWTEKWRDTTIFTILVDAKEYSLLETLFDHHLLPYPRLLYELSTYIKNDSEKDPKNNQLIKLQKQIDNLKKLNTKFNMIPKDKFTSLLSRDDNIYKFLYVLYSKALDLPMDIWKLIGSYFLLESGVEVEAFVRDRVTQAKFIKYHMLNSL